MIDRNIQQLPVYRGIGRRKTAVACVTITKTKEGPKFLINEQPASIYLNANPTLLAKICAPFDLIKIENTFCILVTVHGGGLTGQAEAIQLGLSRAIAQLNENFRLILRGKSALTRDSRRVERKKYGLKKARKAQQYSKR